MKNQAAARLRPGVTLPWSSLNRFVGHDQLGPVMRGDVVNVSEGPESLRLDELTLMLDGAGFLCHSILGIGMLIIANAALLLARERHRSILLTAACFRRQW